MRIPRETHALKRNFIPSLIIFFVFITSGCKKKETVTPIESKIILAVSVTHHDVPVPRLPVYIKFNTPTYPGRDSTKYDVRKLTDESGMVYFSNITPGNHYIYGYGYDADWGMNVIGYHPLIITSSSVVNDTVRTLLYVSE